MIIDCRTWRDLPDKGRSQQGHVFVDGVQIPDVWYVDTEAGLVKTYRIGTDKPQATRGFDRSKYPADWEIDTSDDVVSRTLRGKVEVKLLNEID